MSGGERGARAGAGAGARGRARARAGGGRAARACSCSLSFEMMSLRSSTSAACCCRSFARSSCSPLTAAETSFSFAITSRIMSLRALSSSTVVVSVEKAFSRSSRSVFDSRF